MPEESEGIKELIDDPAHIQQSIEQAREEIASSVLALRDRVNRVVDWRGWVGERPMLVGGLAFMLGVVLGRWSKKRGTRFA